LLHAVVPLFLSCFLSVFLLLPLFEMALCFGFSFSLSFFVHFSLPPPPPPSPPLFFRLFPLSFVIASCMSSATVVLEGGWTWGRDLLLF